MLEAHGWGDLQTDLHALSKQGRWQEMGALIDDDVLGTIAAVGSAIDIAAHIRERADGIADTVCMYSGGPLPVDVQAEIIDALQ